MARFEQAAAEIRAALPNNSDTMTERILPRRRSGGRRHKRVRIYDTQALMELFETDDEEEVRRELARRGVMTGGLVPSADPRWI